MREIISPLRGFGSPFGARLKEEASIVTWDSSADTYTQSLYAEDASVVTWDSSADTYTQNIYGS